MRRSISANEVPTTAVRFRRCSPVREAAAEQRKEALGGSFAGDRPSSRRTASTSYSLTSRWSMGDKQINSGDRQPGCAIAQAEAKRALRLRAGHRPGLVCGLRAVRSTGGCARLPTLRRPSRRRSSRRLCHRSRIPLYVAIASGCRPNLCECYGGCIRPCSDRGLLHHHRETLPRSILFVSAEAAPASPRSIASLALVQRDAGERWR